MPIRHGRNAPVTHTLSYILYVCMDCNEEAKTALIPKIYTEW